MRKNFLALAIFLYGTLVEGFGAFGYLKKLSVASLVSGMLFGSLIQIASLLFWKNKKAGELSTRVLLFLVTIVFSYRYFVSGKMLPAIFAILGAILSLIFSKAMRREPKIS